MLFKGSIVNLRVVLLQSLDDVTSKVSGSLGGEVRTTTSCRLWSPRMKEESLVNPTSSSGLHMPAQQWNSLTMPTVELQPGIRPFSVLRF